MSNLPRVAAMRARPLPLRRVFVHDLVLMAEIGVYRHERGAQQRVRVNLDLGVEDVTPLHDRLDEVVCYATIAEAVRRLVNTGRVNLVETLAERVATLCFEDRRVRTARVRVEKLDAVQDVAAVGIEIDRENPGP